MLLKILKPFHNAATGRDLVKGDEDEFREELGQALVDDGYGFKAPAAGTAAAEDIDDHADDASAAAAKEKGAKTPKSDGKAKA